MNAIGDLLVKIKADTSDLEKGIASASKSMQNAGDSMVATGARLTAGVSAPLLGIGVAAIKAAADFETSMSVLKSVSSATSDEMKKMQQLAIALGNDLTIPGASASDAADAMVELAKAGLSVNDTMSAAKGVLQLAAAGELSTGEAATTAAAALNAFHLQGSEATRVADLLAAAANASAADVRTVGDSMKMAAAVFASAKVPVQDLTTAIALMANSGIQGSDAGTSLKQMLLSLQAPTKKAKDLMADLGIKIYDAQGNMLPMRSLIGNVSKALSGLTQQQRNAALSTIFGSDAIRAANIVLAGGTAAWDAMSGAVNKAGAANQLASARMEGLNGAFAALQNTIETVLLTAALPFMDTLKNIVMFISDGVTQLANINPQFLNAAIAVGAVLAVAGPLTIAIGAIVGVIGTLLSPIGLVVLAVAGLSAAFASGIISIDKIKAAIKKFSVVLKPLANIVETAGNLVSTAIAVMLDTIRKFFADKSIQIQQLFMMLWGNLLGVVNNVSGIVLTVVSGFLGTLTSWIYAHRDQITGVFNGAWTLVTNIITGAMTAIQTVVSIGLGIVQSLFMQGGTTMSLVSTMWTNLLTIVTTVVNGISGIVSGIFGIINSFLINHKDEIQKSVIDIWNLVLQTVNDVLNSINGIIQPILLAINTFLQQHGAEIQTWLGDTWTRISGIIQTALQIIHDVVVPVLNAIGEFISEHSAEIQAFLSGAWQVISDTISGVLTFIQGLLQTVLKAINGDWEGAWETAKTAVSTAWEYISKAIETVLGVIWGFILLHLKNIVQDIQNKFNNALAIVQTLWGNIKTAIVNRITETLTNVRTTFNDVKTAIINRISETLINVRTTFNNVKTAIVNRISEILENVRTTFNDVKTAIINRITEAKNEVVRIAKEFVDKMFQAGKDLIQGLIDGVGEMKDMLINAIKGLIDDAIRKVKEALGIASPSKVFYGFGKNTIQGLINGIEDQRTNLMSLMDDVVSDMIDRFAGVDVTPGIQFGRVDNPYGVPGNVGIINPNTGIIEILPLPKPPEFVAPGIVGGGNGGPGGIGNIADGPKPIWLMTAAEWAERFGVSLAQAMIELANLQNQMLNPNLGLDPGRHDFAPPPGVIGGRDPGIGYGGPPVLPPAPPPGPGNPIGPGGGIPTGPIPIGGITDAIEAINRGQAEIVRRLGEMNSVISNNLSQIGTKIVADSAGVAISYFNSGKQAMDFLVGGLEAGIPALMDELSKINRIMTAGIGNGNVPAAGKGQLSNNTSYNITVNNPVAEKAGDSVRRELFYLSAGVLA